jgi:hypothetical protein
MKRVALLALAFTLCFVALSWKAAEAGLVCSTTYKSTANYAGFGSSCTHAQNNLYNAASNGIGCGNYPACYQSLVVTTGCRVSGSQYRMDGYIRYRCYYCVNGPCPF